MSVADASACSHNVLAWSRCRERQFFGARTPQACAHSTRKEKKRKKKEEKKRKRRKEKKKKRKEKEEKKGKEEEKEKKERKEKEEKEEKRGGKRRDIVKSGSLGNHHCAALRVIASSSVLTHVVDHVSHVRFKGRAANIAPRPHGVGQHEIALVQLGPRA